MFNPLVSVIVPNYNHARFLTERFESILAQTYTNFEIIILDDCSTDNSREIIERYRSNPHVSKIVYNEQNCGNTFEQWMHGIELAQGELCWIAESDDSCLPTLLEKLVPMFEKSKNVSLAVCKCLLIDVNGNALNKHCLSEEMIVENGKDFIRRHLVFNNYICNSGMAVFKRSVALDVNRQFIDKKYAGTGDMMFWIEMCETGEIGLLSECLDLFRIHGTNQTSKREIDGTNSMGRKHILNYLLSKKIISWKTSRLVRLYFLKKIKEDKNLSKDVYIRLCKLWYVPWIERRWWGGYVHFQNFITRLKTNRLK